ncbi:MAG: formate dehydrogenase accessory sulfurtransferase FdhD [Syntrophales bacterium]|nr:formate dehydrogenase accessory sulfurtransferase FdhD [Syntrophales bacterium]
MGEPRLEPVKVFRYQKGSYVSGEETIVPERMVQIFLNDNPLTKIACLGVHIDELAVGFLHSEGYVSKNADIKEIKIDWLQMAVYVYTHRDVEISSSVRVLASSGARMVIEESAEEREFVPDHLSVLFPPERILTLMEEMIEKACVHQITRGTHSAVLADRNGIICLREDIGRHNCIDMLDGYCLLNNIDPSDKCVLRTGRVSLEIVKKLVKMGIRMVASLSVPTLMALELARKSGLILIGRVRDGEMVIYTQ